VFSTIDLAHWTEAQIARTGNTIGGLAEPQRDLGTDFPRWRDGLGESVVAQSLCVSEEDEPSPEAPNISTCPW